MPPGVASHFMDLLAADRHAARRQVLVMAILAVLLTGLAYYLLPWEGAAAHVAAAVIGLALGYLLARRRAAGYEASLRETWTHWMRHSVAAESVPEIFRRVRGQSSRNLPYKFAVLLVLAWALEVLLLALAFREEESLALAVPVIAYNGLLAGGLLGYFIHRGRWTREFGESVKELVESGEIGLRGVL